MSDKQKEKGEPKEQLWRYGAAAIVLLVILTAAILTPDYLNYRYKLAALKRPAPIAQPGATNNLTRVVPPSADEKSSSTQETALKTADIYETYGKLITMLLGFVSVVGVLFGYFVRKNVRELTEDVRSDVQREVEYFKRERESALEKIAEADKKAQLSLTKGETLETKLEALLKSVEERLKALDEAIKSYQEKRSAPSPSTADTTAKVDQELKDQGV